MEQFGTRSFSRFFSRSFSPSWGPGALWVAWVWETSGTAPHFHWENWRCQRWSCVSAAYAGLPGISLPLFRLPASSSVPHVDCARCILSPIHIVFLVILFNRGFGLEGLSSIFQIAGWEVVCLSPLWSTVDWKIIWHLTSLHTVTSSKHCLCLNDEEVVLEQFPWMFPIFWDLVGMAGVVWVWWWFKSGAADMIFDDISWM